MQESSTEAGATVGFASAFPSEAAPTHGRYLWRGDGVERSRIRSDHKGGSLLYLTSPGLKGEISEQTGVLSHSFVLVGPTSCQSRVRRDHIYQNTAQLPPALTRCLGRV